MCHPCDGIETRPSALALLALAWAIACDGGGAGARPSPPAASPPETLAGLRVHVLGGRDGRGSGDGPVVVLLHGYGAPGDDLVPFARSLRVRGDVRFVLPEAPIAHEHGGRAWWPLNLERVRRMAARGEERTLAREVPDGLAEARARVAGLLDAIERELGAAPERTVLGGFSQGAMLAADVALHDDDRFAGLLLLSGTIVAEDVWTERIERVRDVPVLVSHGRSDTVLPFSAAERLRDLFQRGGARVEWVPFDGGHAIPSDVRDRAALFLRGVLD